MIGCRKEVDFEAQNRYNQIKENGCFRSDFRGRDDRMRKRKNVLVSVILIASMLATANPVYVLAEGFSDGEDAFSAGTEMEIQRMDDAAEFESGDSSDYFESGDYPEAGAGELMEEYIDPENAETLVGEDASDGGVEINDTNFPDVEFQYYVKQNFDTDSGRQPLE